MSTPPPMLLQDSKLYTPTVFEAFEGEYKRSLAAFTKVLDGNNEYLVGDFNFEEDYKVIGDPLNQTVECSAVAGNLIELGYCVAMLLKFLI